MDSSTATISAIGERAGRGDHHRAFGSTLRPALASTRFAGIGRPIWAGARPPEHEALGCAAAAATCRRLSASGISKRAGSTAPAACAASTSLSSSCTAAGATRRSSYSQRASRMCGASAGVAPPPARLPSCGVAGFAPPTWVALPGMQTTGMHLGSALPVQWLRRR